MIKSKILGRGTQPASGEGEEIQDFRNPLEEEETTQVAQGRSKPRNWIPQQNLPFSATNPRILIAVMRNLL